MATKTLYLKDASPAGSTGGSLQDGGSAITGATTATRWTTTGRNTPYGATMVYGSTTSLSNNYISAGAPTDSTLGITETWRTENTYRGVFAAANWSIKAGLIAVTAAAGTPKLHFKLWKSAAQNGASASVVCAWTASAAFAAVGTSATVYVTTTLAPGTFNLYDEYLFLQIAIEAGSGSTNSVAAIRVDSGNGIALTTADFTAGSTGSYSITTRALTSGRGTCSAKGEALNSPATRALTVARGTVTATGDAPVVTDTPTVEEIATTVTAGDTLTVVVHAAGGTPATTAATTQALTAGRGTCAATGEGKNSPATRALTAGRGTCSATGEAKNSPATRALTAGRGACAATGEGKSSPATRALTASRGTVGATGEASHSIATRALTAGRGTCQASGSESIPVTYNVTTRALTAGRGTAAAKGEAAHSIATRGLTAARGTASAKGEAAQAATARALTSARGTAAAKGEAAYAISTRALTSGRGTVTATGALVQTATPVVEAVASSVTAGQTLSVTVHVAGIDQATAIATRALTVSRGTLTETGAARYAITTRALTSSRGTVAANGQAAKAIGTRALTLTRGTVLAVAGAGATTVATTRALTISRGTVQATGGASTGPVTATPVVDQIVSAVTVGQTFTVTVHVPGQPVTVACSTRALIVSRGTVSASGDPVAVSIPGTLSSAESYDHTAAAVNADLVFANANYAVYRIDAGAGGTFRFNASVFSLAGAVAEVRIDGNLIDTWTIPADTQGEEEGEAMPAHAVNESTASVLTSSAQRIDGTPSAKRYMVRVVNPGAARIFVGHTAGVTVNTGQCVEGDWGSGDFFVDSNVPLYAIAAGASTISARVFEYVTA